MSQETGQNVKFNRRRVDGKERTMILAITTTSFGGDSKPGYAIFR